MFTTRAGETLDAQNVVNGYFKPLLKRPRPFPRMTEGTARVFSCLRSLKYQWTHRKEARCGPLGTTWSRARATPT